jgi:hypothetical protein
LFSQTLQQVAAATLSTPNPALMTASDATSIANTRSFLMSFLIIVFSFCFFGPTALQPGMKL